MLTRLIDFFTRKLAPVKTETPVVEETPRAEADLLGVLSTRRRHEWYSQAEPDERSMFSTHRRNDSTWSSALELHNRMAKLVAAPEDFKPVSGTGADGAAGNDSVKNAFSLGQQRLPQSLFSWYVSQSFIGYQACAIIAQQWLVNKACSMKGRDAVRNGFEITINDGTGVDADVIDAIQRADKRYKLKQNLKQASRFKEIFGIRHILFLVDSPDPDYYEKPFNPDGILPGSYRGMSQIDPNWITPGTVAEDVSSPGNQYFYDPTYWQVSGKRIHRSHFVVLRGPEVPDILKPSYIYGGLPTTQLIMERVYAAERTANEGPQLALTKRLSVLKTNLKRAVANEATLTDALEAQAANRDNFGMYVVGSDDEVTQLDTTLTDLDNVIMNQHQLVAAIANVPATKLLGTSPKGFNATGEHETKSYHEELETVQEDDLTPLVEKHHVYVMRSEIAPKFNQLFDVTVEWRPVDVPTARDVADTNFIKMQTDQGYQTAGVIDAYEIREKLIADKTSGYNGLESVERPEELEDLEPDDLLTPDEDPEEAPEEGPDEKTEEGSGEDAIRKESKGWYVYSYDGAQLAGPYSNRKKAANSLRKVARHQEAS